MSARPSASPPDRGAPGHPATTGIRPGDERRALLLICSVAFTVSTNYTNHGPVLAFIAREYRLDASSAGVIATAFFLGSGTLMLAAGAVADRLGPRLPITLGYLVVCLSTIACGVLAPTYPLLLAWRFVGGIGGGIAFAAGAVYVRGVFAGRGQHLAQGLFGSSFLAGSAAPLLYMPLVAGPGGDWRLAYAASGLATLVAWAAWWRLAPVPAGATASRPGGGRGNAVARVLGARNTWLLALCHTCGFGLAMVLGTWVVSYLVDGYRLPVVVGGLLGALVLALGIVARSGGGIALERGVAPLRLIRGGLALAAAGLATMALAGSLAVAIAGLVATGLGVGLPYAAVFNGAAVSAPTSPGSAQAFVGWGGALTAIVGPPLIGALLDAGGGYGSGFLAIAGFAVLVLAGTLALRPFSFAAGPEAAEVVMP